MIAFETIISKNVRVSVNNMRMGLNLLHAMPEIGGGWNLAGTRVYD